MKKLSLIVLGLIVFSGLVFGNFSLSTASAEVIELKFGHHIPTASDNHKLFVAYAEKVGKETQGRVKITVYGSGTLIRMEDCLTSVRGGVCDIGFAAYTYEANKLGLNNVMRDPTLNIPSDEIGLRIWTALRNKFPEMRAEEEGFKLLMRSVNTSGGENIHTTGKKIRLPSDMKGMKIIATGDSTIAMKAAGASPISLGSPDWYMSLERKLADGLYGPYTVVDSRGCIPLLPYHLHVMLGRGLFGVLMNLEKWNALPPDIQKIMDECDAWLQDEWIKLNKRLLQKTLNKCNELGQTVYKPTPEELTSWRTLGVKITEAWIKKMDAMGKPGKAVYEEAKRLTKEYVN